MSIKCLAQVLADCKQLLLILCIIEQSFPTEISRGYCHIVWFFFLLTDLNFHTLILALLLHWVADLKQKFLAISLLGAMGEIVIVNIY